MATSGLLNPAARAGQPAPPAPAERIASLDALRGVAVLGILLMNVQSFAMPEAAYLNPTAYGSLAGAEGWVWLASHLLVDRKFMAIFSMLFGAGVLLFSARLEARGSSSAPLHYRRMFWLLVFGLAHAYLLWYGDILVSYALCGMVVYPLRRRAPVTQLGLGLAIMAVASVIALLGGWSMEFWSESKLGEFEATYWKPSLDRIAEEVAAYRGGWLDQMSERVPVAWALQTAYFLTYELWRVTGLMLIGMALFQWGILTGQRSQRFYKLWLLAGGSVGILLTLYGVHLNQRHGWDMRYSFFLGRQISYWVSVPMALAWISLVMWTWHQPWSRRLLQPLVAVGRMAFTNYLLQTVICTFLFYGHGLGLFGRLDRVGQLVVVFGVWIVLLVVSPLWLRFFRFGPLEWLWRSLTYGGRQPMARRPLAAESPRPPAMEIP